MLLTRLLVVAACLTILYVEWHWHFVMRERVRMLKLAENMLQDAHSQIAYLVNNLEKAQDDLAAAIAKFDAR